MQNLSKAGGSTCLVAMYESLGTLLPSCTGHLSSGLERGRAAWIRAKEPETNIFIIELNCLCGPGKRAYGLLLPSQYGLLLLRRLLNKTMQSLCNGP